jgi:hypothetical protein
MELKASLYTSLTNIKHKNDVWISDSACTVFVTCRKDWLNDFVETNDSCKTAHSDHEVQIIGKGSMIIMMNGKRYHIQDVYYSPDFGYNLFPVKYFDERGYTVSYCDGKVIISKGDQIKGVGALGNNRTPVPNLYVLDIQVVVSDNAVSDGLCASAAIIQDCTQALKRLHERLGHMPMRYLRQLVSKKELPISMIKGIDLDRCQEFDCLTCLTGKMTRKHFRSFKHSKVNLRSNRPLGLIHADLVGPIQILTPTKESYILTVVDDFTGYLWTVLLKSKADAALEFKHLLIRLAVETGLRVNQVRYDRGTEINNHEFRQFCLDKGIFLQLVPRHTPQLNGTIERKNRSLIQMTRTIMLGANLPATYWGHACMTATQLINSFASQGRNASRVYGISPYELWHGVRPPLETYYAWGCPVTYLVPEAVRDQFKFTATGAPGWFLGYGCGFYHVLTIDSKVLDVPHGEVVFLLDDHPERGGKHDRVGRHGCASHDNHQDLNNNSSLLKQLKSSNLGKYWDLEDSTEVEHDNNVYEHSDCELEEYLNDDSEATPTVISSKSSRQSTRLAKQKTAKMNALLAKYHSADQSNLALINNLLALPKTPKTVEEALSSPEREQWRVAMQSEYESLIKNGTWQEVQNVPKGRKALPCKWIFKIKLNSTGGIERYKARLVIKGFKQVEGLDYTETFAPVAKFSTIRLMLAVTAALDLDVEQMDFSTAFLNGDLQEEIYMSGPPGTIIEGKVVKLVKSLYGLKQAPRCWNHKINQYLVSQGFIRCQSDNCLYVMDGFYILLYVDDILLFSNDKVRMEQVKADLRHNFAMHDLGALEFIVGIRVRRDREKRLLYLDQAAYCERILQKFGMNQCKSVKTPIFERLIKSDQEASEEFPYRSVVGSLMYLMVGTRPDIAVTCSELSKYLEHPDDKHVVAAKRVLRYLQGTKNYVLVMDGTKSLQPVGFADADYANDLETRRSMTGYYIEMCGAAISWKSKLQNQTALSTTEAEYYAAASCCQDICWIQECLTEIGFDFKQIEMVSDRDSHELIQTHPMEVLQEPMVIKEDNQACIAISKNPEKHSRTKHIEVKYHFIRDLVSTNRVKLQYCSTEDQHADILTKPLSEPKFAYHRKALGLQDHAE